MVIAFLLAIQRQNRTNAIIEEIIDERFTRFHNMNAKEQSKDNDRRIQHLHDTILKCIENSETKESFWNFGRYNKTIKEHNYPLTNKSFKSKVLTEIKINTNGKELIIKYPVLHVINKVHTMRITYCPSDNSVTFYKKYL